jgi:hypothetical protein
MFTESWPAFKGGEAGGEHVAIIGESEVVVGIGALVEGSSRATSVLCRKDPSTLSGDCDESVRCSCVSGLDSAEGVGDKGVT